ncbi:MAG: hypothetical protein EOP46_08945 [Sphingobacteriaceae bacterium]|nr:MAG: hypothetical protein EOP46_08945 [Sphingobacteriaceae bacterium]
MNLIKSTILSFAVFISLFITLQSCTKTQPDYWHNNEIDVDMRNEFHENNHEVIKQLKAYNIRELENHLAKKMVNNVATKREAERLGNTLRTAEFVLLDEYYAINKYRDYDTITTRNKAVNNYYLRYEGFAKEMYIALFAPKTGDERSLITLIYAKFDYGWKLCDMDVAPYMFWGKTAPQLYELAKAQFQKGQLINAKLTTDLAITAAKPSKIWEYSFNQEFRLLNSKLSYDANQQFTFPLVLNKVPTKPQVFAIYIKPFSQGTFPIIQYLTKIPLKDKEKIIEENNRVKVAIAELMPGINTNKKYLMYAAFNEMPKFDRSVDRYEITEKLQ